MTDSIQHDIVIIGGGGAGLRAAIAAAEANPELDIAVVSKVFSYAQPYRRCRRGCSSSDQGE